MKKIKIIPQIFLAFIAIALFSCKSTSEKNIDVKSKQVQIDSVVFAKVETTPVTSSSGEDAADDPAIWYNREKPEKSLIIGTNKKTGLHVYNLNGEELFFAPIGRVNNVDLRYGFMLANGEKVDIIGATNRTDNSLTLMQVMGESGELKNIASSKTISKVSEVYGFTFYHNIKSHKYYAFIGGKKGETEQYELVPTADNKITAKLLRTFNFDSQTEGMVADDELGYLYVAEEDKCIWKSEAAPNSKFAPQKVELSDSSNPKIKFDIEGISIYYAANGKGYLLASIQGNYSYAIFSREEGNEYIGSFSIKDKIVDGVEETDGLDVLNLALGDKFPNGVLVTQDGFNYDGESFKSQNFKLIPWEQIAGLIEPLLVIDNKYSGFIE